MRKSILLILAFFFCARLFAQHDIQLALLKYRGGGDWYSVVDALENLAEFCNRELNTSIDPEYATVDVGSRDIFNYPFLFLTGHGNVLFSPAEAENLRKYLEAGGFLFIDDDYGLNKYIRTAMKSVFPDKEFVELPFDHPIYHQKYDMPDGLPKIHKHDGLPPKGYAILIEGRVAVFYGYESNISDGWDSPDVHHDPPELRKKALEMGANLIQFAFTN